MELNINQNVSDAFYRYKMPQLSAKVEGKGNGIKTVIVNVTEIAKRLYRKPIYVTKYFGCELGAQIHVDERNDRYIVNGAHDAARLQELLFGFINKFVLCTDCGNPETNLRVKVKAGVVNTTCSACGNRGILDPRHRLTQFIIKNPPVEETVTVDKKVKKSRKARNGNAEEEDHSPAGDENHNSPGCSDSGDDDWGEDTTEEAQQKRLDELSSMARSLTVNTDVEKSETERANVFFKYLTLLKHDSKAAARGHEIKVEAERLNLGVRAVLVVAEVLISDPKTMIADIKLYKPVFLQFTRVGEHTLKAQRYVLGAMASLIDKYASENLVAKSCHILKEFYDSDILEEEVILSWFDKNSVKRYTSKEMAAKISRTCKPMLTWLAEADIESEGEEDYESGDGSESNASSVRGTANSSSATTSPKTTPQAAVTNADDDLDIDAI